MNCLKIPALLVLSFAALPSLASELDLALGEDTAAAEFLVSPEALNVQNANVTIGGAYNDNDDLLGYVGLSSGNSPIYSQPFELGVGGRVYYASIDQPDSSASAIALGVHGRLNLSAGFPVALAGSFYYAPDITTFMDGDDFMDARIRLESDITPNASAFIGYRDVKVGMKSGPSYHLDEDIHLGVRFKF